MQPAALVVVQHPNSKEILLVKRKDVPIWVLPGGGIDAGESPVEAAKRELLEETNLLADHLDFRCHFMPVNRWAAETSIFYTNHFEGTLRRTNETADVAFFSLEKLPKNLFVLHKKWLLKALSTNVLIEGKIEEVTWKSIIVYAMRYPKIVLRFLWTYLTKL